MLLRDLPQWMNIWATTDYQYTDEEMKRMDGGIEIVFHSGKWFIDEI